MYILMMVWSVHLVLLTLVVSGVLPVCVQGEAGSVDHRIALNYSSVIIITANEIFVGVTLSLRGDPITTNGSGRIVITDINPDGDPNDEDALICQSELPFDYYGGNWFLHPTHQTTQLTTDGSIRIDSTDSRGWRRNRATFTINGTETGRLVRLRRDDTIASGGRALEGVFTCDIEGDINTPVSVGIYYPSELHDVPYYAVSITSKINSLHTHTLTACMCLCIYSLISGCHNQCAVIKTRNIHSDLHCQWWDCCEQFSHWTWRSGP